MPNLEGLGLQNFRTFKEKEDLEFAPITLITGSNNTGKSSLFKAIQFLVHNFKDGIVSETLDFRNMKHELGNLDRVLNRVTMKTFKNSEVSIRRNMYSKLSNFHKDHKGSSDLPIFEEDEDLVFAFPIKFGNSREIRATLEIRYGLDRFKKKETNNILISHYIKNIAIIRKGQYLHWSNILGLMENYDDSPHWEMETSIDLKRIIKLIIETPLAKIKDELHPNKLTEEYFTIDLYSRIEKFKSVLFDFPFTKNQKDDYKIVTEKFTKGKSLFSDYSKISDKEKSKLLAIEGKIVSDLFKGKSNNQNKILDFNHSFSSIMFGMERDIAKTELKEESTEKKQNSNEENLKDYFESSMFQTTPNSKLFSNLLAAIEKDFFNTIQKKINSLKKVYFLPTTRGRSREWFIDEQNSEDIQIIRDFSDISLEDYPQIKNFVNFWIGKGEINENGEQKQKGFKIGKELSVFRDETIGLTKIFLVNFDGTKTPLVDLGYGISQLLPIIMKIAIVAKKHQVTHEYDWNNRDGYYKSETIYFSPSTLLIEEPEANLHPSLQSKMAELFIDAASRFNIQFLVETHSEYLIYKFQEYIGQKKVSKNDIKMYYFNHPNDAREGVNDNYINEVQIGKDGSIDYDRYFGKGFFDEQLNLKLSLLNIQRESFIEDYETIKEELKKSGEILEGYSSEIENINQELVITTSGKDELEYQLKEIKEKKEKTELELQKLIKEQEDKIDEYTAKIDYSKYLTEIQSIVDKNKIDNSKTLQYLSTGKFLLENLDVNADFAPVVIQYGRAVEFEMIKWVNDFKNTISSNDVNNWCNATNYISKIRQVFIGLGLTLDTNDNYVIDIDKKVNLLNLRNYIKGSPNWVFGKLTQIFELFYYVSPIKNTNYNYNSVPLMKEFSKYLNNLWKDYNTAESLFDTCRYILDLRNCAGHTYNNNVCSSDIIDKRTAEDYVAKVEAIFTCL